MTILTMLRGLEFLRSIYYKNSNLICDSFWAGWFIKRYWQKKMLELKNRPKMHFLCFLRLHLEYKPRTYFPRDVAHYQADHVTNQLKDLPHILEADPPTYRDRKAGKIRENLRLLIGHVTRYPAPTLVGLKVSKSRKPHQWSKKPNKTDYPEPHCLKVS